MYDLDSKEFFVSRDVVFIEKEFPYDNTVEHEKLEHNGIVGHFGREETLSETTEQEHDSGGDREITERQLDDSQRIEISGVREGTDEHVNTNIKESLGRGHKERRASTRLHDYVLHTVQKSTSSLSPSPRSPDNVHSSGSPYPIKDYINCDNFSVAHRVFLAAVTAGVEPNSFGEAMKDEKWRKSMQKEIQALEDNVTWTVQSLPQGKRAINCKWVYKIKYNADGTIERYKARLVILGNRQLEGIDYHETFAPVAKMVTVRTYLAVAAAKDWEIHQMDVHNAFLHGDLQEEMYMTMPPGFNSGKPGMVCRLNKSLYGLRRAPRCWFAKLAAALTHYGFTQSYSDYSLFTLRKDKIQLNVLVYVDDLIISGNDHETALHFKGYLSTCFHMKDLGSLKYFLGIEVARSPAGIFLCQRKYTLDIISEVGLLGSKPVSIPLEQNHNLALANGASLADPEVYRRLVGRLIYLSVTRPELAYCVHVLAQFMQHPREQHWEAALRVMRYLKVKPGKGIMLRSDCDLRLYAWCDSDWAGCPLTRRSLTRWFILLGNSPISWKTKKQHTVSRSSAEAEYRSMATTTCELKWLKELLVALNVDHPIPINLYCDSQAALHIATNPVFHERTKHIEIDCHFVRAAIQSGMIKPNHVKTSAQITLRPLHSLICSQKRLESIHLNIYFASWAFETCMLQLEGGCWK